MTPSKTRRWEAVVATNCPTNWRGVRNGAPGFARRKRAGKREFVSTLRITAFEPPKILAFVLEGKGMTGQMQFTLAPAAAGTQVHYQAEMKGHGLMSLMTGTINRMMAKLDADLLDRLQAHLERRA